MENRFKTGNLWKYMYAIERKDDFITDNSILDLLRVGTEPTRARLQKHVLVFGERKTK